MVVPEWVTYTVIAFLCALGGGAGGILLLPVLERYRRPRLELRGELCRLKGDFDADLLPHVRSIDKAHPGEYYCLAVSNKSSRVSAEDCCVRLAYFIGESWVDSLAPWAGRLRRAGDANDTDGFYLTIPPGGSAMLYTFVIAAGAVWFFDLASQMKWVRLRDALKEAAPPTSAGKESFRIVAGVSCANWSVVRSVKLLLDADTAKGDVTSRGEEKKSFSKAKFEMYLSKVESLP